MSSPSRHAALALAVCLVGTASAAGCSRSERGDGPLTVFAAASLTDALSAVAEAFTRTAGAAVRFNFAGSNVLAQQLIAAGPVADVFISADERWLDRVAAAGLVTPGTRGAVLNNRLVVVAHAAAPYAPLRAAGELADLPFAHLALGDPSAVPAGRYAAAWLAGVPKPGAPGRSVWQAVQGRVVPAADVRAALALVEADPSIVGVVYRSDAATSARVKVLWEVPPGAGPAIRYASALLNRTPPHPHAAAFLAFLTGPEARVILDQHGFTAPPGGRGARE